MAFTVQSSFWEDSLHCLFISLMVVWFCCLTLLLLCSCCVASCDHLQQDNSDATLLHVTATAMHWLFSARLMIGIWDPQTPTMKVTQKLLSETDRKVVGSDSKETWHKTRKWLKDDSSLWVSHSWANLVVTFWSTPETHFWATLFKLFGSGGL